MVHKSVRTVALMGVSSFLIFGQTPDEKNRATTTTGGDNKTMTGCLSSGSGPNQFSFVEDGSGKRYTVTGVPELSKHAMNHTVRITADSSMGSKNDAATKRNEGSSTPPGNETRERHTTNKESSGGTGGETIKVTKVEHVSDTCRNR